MRLAVIACSTKSDSEFMEACSFASDEWAAWKQVTSFMAPASGLAAFNRYIEDYLPQFPFWKTESKGDDGKLDGFLVTAATLLDSCTPDYVENMPLGKMLVWAMAKNEAQGYPNKNLMSDFEVETLRSNPAFAEAV